MSDCIACKNNIILLLFFGNIRTCIPEMRKNDANHEIFCSSGMDCRQKKTVDAF